jgi:hypothetical protein
VVVVAGETVVVGGRGTVVVGAGVVVVVDVVEVVADEAVVVEVVAGGVMDVDVVDEVLAGDVVVESFKKPAPVVVVVELAVFGRWLESPCAVLNPTWFVSFELELTMLSAALE